MIETPNLKLKIPEPTDATDNPYYFKEGFSKIDTAVAELGVDKADATHNHDGTYARSSHSHPYLPITGGSVTGNLTVAGQQVYHTGNITCSTAVPSSFLGEGVQHQVYS